MSRQALLKLRFAQANFEKTSQQLLGQEHKIQYLNEKLTNALFTLEAAEKKQTAAIDDPEQHQAASLLIEQTRSLIQSLNNDLDKEENHLPACIEALKTARVTLNEAEAFLSQSIPHKTLSAFSGAPLQYSTPYRANNDRQTTPIACRINQPINDDNQTLSPFHFYSNDAQTIAPIANGASYYDEGILLPASTLGNSYFDLDEAEEPPTPPSTPTSAAAPSPSMIQTLPAQWALQRTYQQLNSLTDVALKKLPAASPT